VSALALLSCCPGCRSRDVQELAPEDDRVFWVRLRCRGCGYEWAARS